MNERPPAKSYPAEFKESAVKLAVESGRPVAQTARELGVSKDTLYSWVRQYHGKQQVVQAAGALERELVSIATLTAKRRNASGSRGVYQIVRFGSGAGPRL